MERRSFVHLGLNPDLTVIAMHHTLTDSKADTRAGNGLTVQPFEDSENLAVIFGCDAHAIVLE